LANAVGAIPIATTRNKGKKKSLQDAGAKFVVNTKTDGWVEKVREITSGKGVDLAFDPVAGPEIERVAQTMRSEGTIFEYGALSPEPTPFPFVCCSRKQSHRSGLHIVLDCDEFGTVRTGEALGYSIMSRPAN
jgi:NADPH:quinone reductase-like Zn-dependent oxidoreductase